MVEFTESPNSLTAHNRNVVCEPADDGTGVQRELHLVELTESPNSRAAYHCNGVREQADDEMGVQRQRRLVEVTEGVIAGCQVCLNSACFTLTLTPPRIRTKSNFGGLDIYALVVSPLPTFLVCSPTAWKADNTTKIKYITRAKEITRAVHKGIITQEIATNMYTSGNIKAHNSWKATLTPESRTYIENEDIHMTTNVPITSPFYVEQFGG